MPRRNIQALTNASIKRTMTPGDYSDGFGLTLRVDLTGHKRWFQRLTVDGKRRNMGLGSYPAVTLEDARKLAFANVRAAKEGRDPIQAKRDLAAKGRMPKAPMFREVAERVMKLRRPTWTPRVAETWKRTLEQHVYPSIGTRLCYAVTGADVLAILEPMWNTTPRQADCVKHRLKVVFDYAVANEWRPDNPVTKAQGALPRRKGDPVHHEAMPYTDIPGFIRTLRESTAEPVTQRAVEFLILTAARLGEVRLMTWDEVDLDTATWTVPAARMKMRREHKVPLSARALEILQEAQALRTDLIFPIGARTVNKMLDRLELPGTAHGFRSAFKDWSLEIRGADWTLSEAALAHALGNRVETAYARTTLFERRRDLMDSWAGYCGGL